MKPALNEQLKEKFFMLYYGQRVFMMPHFKLPNTLLLSELIGHNVSNGYLSLRPLSDITDEEKEKVYRIVPKLRKHGAENICQDFIDDFGDPYNESAQNWLHLSDYLRSIGIALPFMGYTVEELISAGYCKVGKDGENV